MNQTTLPIEIWEKIVDNLPAPPPKLVPGIIFTRTGTYDEFRIHVSKAVSIDERGMICVKWPGYRKFPKNGWMWLECGTHDTKECLDWSMVNECIIRAQFLGYAFLDKEDRKKSESYPCDLTNNMRICMYKPKK